MNTGVISIGVRCPIIKQGNDIKSIVIDNVLKTLDENGMALNDNDIIGITESVVARAQGNYVTVNNIVDFLRNSKIKKSLYLFSPIMSRNRFSVILRAFARYANSIVIILDGMFDEQGNLNYGKNPFTGVDIQKYYEEIGKEENCSVRFIDSSENYCLTNEDTYIDCRCHPKKVEGILNLTDIMNTPTSGPIGFNEDFGLLGSNRAGDERLKLFPRVDEAKYLVYGIKNEFYQLTGKNVEVMVYSDGCFHSPEIDGIPGSSINEWADPVTSMAYTDGLRGTPNEIKIKAFADGKYNSLSGEELDEAIKKEIINSCECLKGMMDSQGTTPRRYIDLLTSLMDLMSGSGSKGTPVVIVKNYFKNYAQE